jgi:hypothetical protein
MPLKHTKAIKALLLLIPIIVGLGIIWCGLQNQSSLPEQPSYFQKTLPGYSGRIAVYLKPQQAFVVGDNITTEVAVNVFDATNKTYLIEIYFPDAVINLHSPLYPEKQDFEFWLTEPVHLTNGDTIYFKTVNLMYLHEGSYGLNMTVNEFEGNTRYEVDFPNIIQIKPSAFLEEQKRADSAYALNQEVVGLAVITLGPILVMLIDVITENSETKATRKTTLDDPSVGEDL